MKTDWLSWAGVAGLTMIWGASFALTEVALRGFHPMALATGRVCLAACAMLLAARITGAGLPVGRAQWRACGILGVFSLAVPFSLLSWGQQFVDSSIASIFIAGTPLFILALSRFALGDPIRPRQWGGFAIGFLGLVWLVDPGPALFENSNGLAALACLGAAASYGCASILVRLMPPMHPVTATAGSTLTASLLTLPFGLMHLPEALPLAAPVLALLVLGVLQTGLAQLLRYFTVKRAGPVFVSIVGYLIPIWAAILGIVFLAETPGWRAALAYGLIVSGLLLSRTAPTRHK